MLLVPPSTPASVDNCSDGTQSPKLHEEGGLTTLAGAPQRHELAEGCKAVLEEAWDSRAGIRGGDRESCLQEPWHRAPRDVLRTSSGWVKGTHAGA